MKYMIVMRRCVTSCDYCLNSYCIYVDRVKVLVITRARVQAYGKYWHSSDVSMARKPSEGFTELLCKYFSTCKWFVTGLRGFL